MLPRIQIEKQIEREKENEKEREGETVTNHTFIASRMRVHVMPRIVSLTRIDSKLLMISIQVPVTPSTSDLFFISRPKRLPIWPEAMVMAAAEVKPAVTGTEMKSIKKPREKHDWFGPIS